tara:strand:+ start:10865 stop:11506 length:642 start_codon:yes stop_codon:yes gene_type:complete
MIRSYLSGWKNAFNTKARTSRNTYFEFVFVDILIVLISFFAIQKTFEYCDDSWVNVTGSHQQNYAVFGTLCSDRGSYSSLNSRQKYGLRKIDQQIITYYLFIIIYMTLTTIPRVSITARRIRDTGKNINWVLFTFLPIPGWLILLFLTMQESISAEEKVVDQSFPITITGNTYSQHENPNTLESKIEELNRLKEKGIISEEEYEKMRKNTLGL